MSRSPNGATDLNPPESDACPQRGVVEAIPVVGATRFAATVTPLDQHPQPDDPPAGPSRTARIEEHPRPIPHPVAPNSRWEPGGRDQPNAGDGGRLARPHRRTQWPLPPSSNSG